MHWTNLSIEFFVGALSIARGHVGRREEDGVTAILGLTPLVCCGRRFVVHAPPIAVGSRDLLRSVGFGDIGDIGGFHRDQLKR